MITAVKENNRTSETHSKNNVESDGRNFCTWIDAETAMLLDEIRNKYSKETNATILAKAIRNLHDMTCRTFIRTIQPS